MSFSIPPRVLGLPGDDADLDLSEARKSYWLDVVIPMYLNPLTSSLTNYFFADQPNAVIKADYDSIPAVREARIAHFEVAERASFLTVNEKRKLLAYPPVSAEQGGELIPLVEKIRNDSIRATVGMGWNEEEDTPTGGSEQGDPLELSEEGSTVGTQLAQPNGKVVSLMKKN
jgi:hypothetical protein